MYMYVTYSQTTRDSNLGTFVFTVRIFVFIARISVFIARISVLTIYDVHAPVYRYTLKMISPWRDYEGYQLLFKLEQFRKK